MLLELYNRESYYLETPKGPCSSHYQNIGHITDILKIDKKCPFTGMVSIRGRILTGTVVSTKMHRTVIIRREYLHYVPKYNRYEKRHKNLAAHVSPAFRVEEGDMVTVGQCRPLSKTVCGYLSPWTRSLCAASCVVFRVIQVLLERISIAETLGDDC